jgi:hypothetical protein
MADPPSPSSRVCLRRADTRPGRVRYSGHSCDERIDKRYKCADARDEAVLCGEGTASGLPDVLQDWGLL